MPGAGPMIPICDDQGDGARACPTVRACLGGAALVVAPGTAIGCAHVPRPGRAIGEPVAQVHGALRTGYRRFEECDVRGHRATVEHLLPDAEHDRVHPEVETVEEHLVQEGLHQVQAPDDLHVLVPVTDLAHRAGQIRPELRGPGPREVGPAAGGHVLRDAVEQRGDLVVLAALLVRPVGGEDVIRPPAEQEGVRALVRGTDLRPGDLVQQGRLPAAEREPHRVFVGAAGRLTDEVEGCEQLDVDEAHALLPMSWLSLSGGRPAGADRLIADYSRWSLIARLGTTKDARKRGKNLLPVHRKATTSPSAASKVSVRLEFRPLRTWRV